MVLPLLIHGDAAFAGQGVIAECLGLSGLKGHRTGGSIHFVINNQIGFTTRPIYSRSSPYPTDVAKMIEAPVFHVNGDDPEAVVYVAKIAIEFRQRFAKPVVIDMFCYRRFGHNEGDEPSFTQPLMYAQDPGHKSTLELYAERLVAEGLLTAEDIDKLKADWRAKLEGEFEAGQDYRPNKADWLDGAWKDLKRADADGPRRGETGVDRSTSCVEIGTKLSTVPEGFNVHKTVKRFLDNRLAAIESRRGHRLGDGRGAGLRHAGRPRATRSASPARTSSAARSASATRCSTTRRPTRPTPRSTTCATDQARYEVINSMLSEEAVLGFEYGYSLAEPTRADPLGSAVRRLRQRRAGGHRPVHLVGRAQVVPHVGPRDAPAARLRRPGSGALLGPPRALPAALRRGQHAGRQLHDAGQLLPRPPPPGDARFPQAADPDDAEVAAAPQAGRLGAGEMGPESCFHRLLWDDAEAPGPQKTTIKLSPDDKIRRVVLCSGKVYYDLLEEREKRGIDDVYLLRIEQLYPFPAKALLDELSRFKNAEIVWCQEEPKNMGAWAFVQPYLDWVLDQMGRAGERPRYTGRPASASTATGLMRLHQQQLQAFLEEAFAD